MTIKSLINTCINIHPDTEFMVYHSIEDFTDCTSNWNSCRADSLTGSNMKIVAFEVVRADFSLIAVALA